jgi:hypothetical protein
MLARVGLDTRHIAIAAVNVLDKSIPVPSHNVFFS